MTRKIATVDSTSPTVKDLEAVTEQQQLPATVLQLHDLQSELNAINAELKTDHKVAHTHAQAIADAAQQNTAILGELKACQTELKSSKAELKIFKECAESQGQRVMEVQATLADEKHSREAVERRLQHILKLINSMEDIHWEKARTQTVFDEDAWRTWCQRIEGALEPLIRQSRV